MSNAQWRTGMWRTRWAAIGAAVAVTLGAGGLFTASAAIGSGERTVFVPITPCRIMDTRPGEPNTGPRATPIGAEETHTIDVRGTNGKCTIPADAVGVSLNVTALNGTSGSFLTVFPADVTKPGASSLNWQPGQPPTPNGVVADLAADGRLSFYNFAGTVDVIADVVGYYADHNHDDRYYTKAQVDASLAGKANTADVNAALAGKANTADVNTALAGKADSISGTSTSVVISPASFVFDGDLTTPVTYFLSFNGELTADPGGCFAAPVSLPQGATVTEVTLAALDNGPGNVWLRLVRDPQGGTASAPIADVQTANSATEQTITTSAITNPVIDSASNAYFLALCIGDAAHAFYSARITYTNP